MKSLHAHPSGAPSADGGQVRSTERSALLAVHHDDDDDEHESEVSLHKERRTLSIACVLTLFFFFVELIGGYYAHSLAVMSDAAHLLSDLAGLLISLIAVSLSRVPPSELMSFGYARAEVLGAFVSLIFIWSLTAVLVVVAIRRFFEPQHVDGKLMMVLGAIGLLVNILLGVVLGHGHHGHSHDHSAHPNEQHAHSHSHSNGYAHAHDMESAHNGNWDEGVHSRTGAARWIDWDRWTGSGIGSMNVRAAYLHVIGDALQNIGVLVAAAIITVYPKLRFIDPVCTLIFACIVVLTTKGLAIQTMTVLMEGSPPGTSLRAIVERLRGLNGVLRVDHLHVWSITAKRPALSVHLYKNATVSDHEILQEAQSMLSAEFSIDHCTIQVNCDKDCCDESMAQKHCLPSSALS